MAAAAASLHDALLPRPPGGNGTGAALAVAVHLALAAGLSVTVDWRAQTPEVVSAEIWASVPQAAAPRPVEALPAPAPAAQPLPPPATAPPPPAPEPDIALEREQKRRAEVLRRQAEAEAEKARRDATLAEARKEAQRQAQLQALQQTQQQTQQQAQNQARKEAQAEAQRAEQAARDAERLARQREDNLRRLIDQAGTATGGTGGAAHDAAPSASYGGKVVARIRPQIVFTGAVEDNAVTEVEVRTTPGGTILSRQLKKSSGFKEWDDAVQRAIDKTQRLPPDVDGRVPDTLLLVFRPRG